MKATFGKPVSNGKNLSREKELIRAMDLVGTYQGTLRSLITVRVWAGYSRSSSRVYATIWVRIGDLYTSGTSYAGGGGYHKASAALDGAISNAGITLDTDISGVGDDAMERALEAIAKAAGVRGKTVIITNS